MCKWRSENIIILINVIILIMYLMIIIDKKILLLSKIQRFVRKLRLSQILASEQSYIHRIHRAYFNFSVAMISFMMINRDRRHLNIAMYNDVCMCVQNVIHPFICVNSFLHFFIGLKMPLFRTFVKQWMIHTEFPLQTFFRHLIRIISYYISREKLFSCTFDFCISNKQQTFIFIIRQALF